MTGSLIKWAKVDQNITKILAIIAISNLRSLLSRKRQNLVKTQVNQKATELFLLQKAMFSLFAKMYQTRAKRSSLHHNHLSVWCVNMAKNQIHHHATMKFKKRVDVAKTRSKVKWHMTSISKWNTKKERQIRVKISIPSYPVSKYLLRRQWMLPNNLIQMIMPPAFRLCTKPSTDSKKNCMTYHIWLHTFHLSATF